MSSKPCIGDIYTTEGGILIQLVAVRNQPGGDLLVDYRYVVTNHPMQMVWSKYSYYQDQEPITPWLLGRRDRKKLCRE